MPVCCGRILRYLQIIFVKSDSESACKNFIQGQVYTDHYFILDHKLLHDPLYERSYNF